MSDLSKLEIPGHLTFTVGKGGLPKIRIESEHSLAEIYLHGAHITHFQKFGEPPLLFLSGSSEFDCSKPIRGGVPIIFPWFGPREGLPAHGFARTAAWNLTATSALADGSVELHLRLPDVEAFSVEFIVTVGKSLTMEMTVTNESSQDSTFENCLHTYFQISDIHAIAIIGLQNTTYHDKVADVELLETAPALRFDREVDRVYFDTSATTEILDPGLKRTIRVEKSGSSSTVVWNPWIDKSKRMADFGDDEYLQMVCVESGNVSSNEIILPPGGRAVMKVEVSSEKLA